MLGRGKLPVLAEISAPDRGESRLWSLRRGDYEALREVREQLEARRLVVVTGSDGLAAGAAVALAGAASAAGRRAALLECDLAEPRVAVELGLAPTPGLHEYLRWEATAAQILQPLVLAGPEARGAGEALVCIAAGRPAADPSILLDSESFRHATAKLASAYELTVVVAPPLDDPAGVLESVAIRADAVLACVRPGEAAGRGGRAVRRALRRLPAPTLGAIVVSEVVAGEVGV
jgi:Mrp family chromosome partitioning ATPase